MKTIFTSTFCLAPLAAGIALFFSAEATAATTAPMIENGTSIEMLLDRGDKSTSKAGDIKKPMKRKKVKQKRTNHGPRKPLFPQVHRKQESLNRATYRNPYETKRK